MLVCGNRIVNKAETLVAALGMADVSVSPPGRGETVGVVDFDVLIAEHHQRICPDKRCAGKAGMMDNGITSTIPLEFILRLMICGAVKTMGVSTKDQSESG